MPSAKRRKKEATTPAKPREPSEDASDMPPVPDDVRFANSLANALSASDLLHELRGAGGLTSTAYIVGEHDTDEADVLRAAVATAEAALQTKKVKVADRTNPLAQWPLVEDKDKLGEGAPDSFHDGHLSEAAQKLRRLRWTPQQLLVYLQARRQQQLIHPSRPKCCFCLSMLSYIDGDALVRALFRQAYGPMWLADGDCVLVNRLLMEAIADRTVSALMKEDGDKEQWDRTTMINVRTDKEGRAQFVGEPKSGKNDTAARKAADWVLERSSNSVAGGIYKYCQGLADRDHAARAFADVTAYASRSGSHGDVFELPGDADVFTASNVEDKDVSLALLEDGSAGRQGRLQLLLPVWCSVLKAMITMRVFLGRKSVDAVSEPSVEQTTDMRDAVVRLKDAEGSPHALQKVYVEANLIHKRREDQNGSRCWIVAKKGKYKVEHPEVLQGDLNKGLNGAERMRKAAHAVAGRVAVAHGLTAEKLAAHCEDPKERAQMYAIVAAAAEKVRESVPDLETMPTSSFSDGMVTDFETFAGEVEKELNLSGLGCISGVKGGGAGKRSKKRSSGGGPKQSSGGKRPAPVGAFTSKRPKKPAAKRPRTGPSSSKGRRETSPERQERLNQRDRVPKNADPRAQERGAAAAEAGRRRR